MNGDQKDIVAQLEAANAQVTKLTTERDTAATQLTAAQGQVTSLTTEREAAKTEAATAKTQLTAAQGQVTSLTTERDTAKSEAATAINQLGQAQLQIGKLQAGQKDFDIRLSAELVKYGVRPNAVTLPFADTKSDGTKMTATEQVIAAKLVATK